MSTMSFHSGAPLFERCLRPTQSASRDEQIIALGLLALGFIAAAAFCIAIGVWVVALYFLLTLFGLSIAFQRFNRRSADHENLTIDRDRICVQIIRAQKVRAFEFPVAWARLERVDDEDYGCQKLYLKFRQQRLEIGARISAPERGDLADALETAVAYARRPDLSFGAALMRADTAPPTAPFAPTAARTGEGRRA